MNTSHSKFRLKALTRATRHLAALVAFGALPLFGVRAAHAEASDGFDGSGGDDRSTKSPDDVSGDTGAEGADDTEHEKRREFGVFLNPLGFVFGVINGDVDYLATPHVALTAGGSYLNWGIVQGYGVHAGPQFFVTDEGFRGVYVMPRVGIESVKLDFEGFTETTSMVELGATAGYQWQWKDGFSARLGAGFAYYAATGGVDDIDPSRYSGVYGRVDGSVGWTF